MKIGDLVRYKPDDFVTHLVYTQKRGIVIDIDPTKNSPHRPVQVRWNTVYSNTLWHGVEQLEVISEIKSCKKSC